MRRSLPGVGVVRLPAAARWLGALCMVATSTGCILTQDLPDPALDTPPAYQAGNVTDPDAPPTLDWWRGFRSPELTQLMEEAQTVNLDIAAAVDFLTVRSALAGELVPGRDLALTEEIRYERLETD